MRSSGSFAHQASDAGRPVRNRTALSKRSTSDHAPLCQKWGQPPGLRSEKALPNCAGGQLALIVMIDDILSLCVIAVFEKSGGLNLLETCNLTTAMRPGGKADRATLAIQPTIAFQRKWTDQRSCSGQGDNTLTWDRRGSSFSIKFDAVRALL